MSDGHSHNHSTGNIRLAFFLNLVSAIAELAIGFWTNSLVIFSQALHDFSDTLSLGFSWYFAKLSQKSRTEQLSYGYKRYSMLSAVITSLFILVASLFVMVEAVNRIMHPVHSDAPKMLIFALIGIATNGIAVLRLRSGKTMNEKVAVWHLLDDVLGWIAVLVVSILIQIRDIHILDPIFSLGITFYVLWNVLRNLRQSILILMQGVPQTVNVAVLEQKIKELERVNTVHDTHVWSLDGEHNILTIHVVVDDQCSTEEALAIKASVREIAEEQDITHTTVEVESHDEACALGAC